MVISVLYPKVLALKAQLPVEMSSARDIEACRKGREDTGGAKREGAVILESPVFPL